MNETAIKRVVVKLGTRVLTLDDGRLAQERLDALIEDVADLMRLGKEVLLVSSGAVGLGRDAIGLPPGPSDLATRQACAAIGQGRLMGIYEQKFATHNLCCAQVLLTQSDFDDRQRYENLSRTLKTLLRHRVIPIINENDVVATDELAYVNPRLAGASSPNTAKPPRVSFGDNDQLAAILAANLDADLLVLLTDVDAVYDKNPVKNADAQRIQTWTVSTEVNADQDPGAGRGGMRSKIRSASHAARAGCTAVIASGREEHTLQRVFSDDKPGTWFPPMGRLSPEHQWMVHTAKLSGIMYVKPGRADMLSRPQTSLLAGDVERVEGAFIAGQVVEIRTEGDAIVGRGAASCPADIARAWTKRSSREDPSDPVVLVRWDKLVLGTQQ